ncbi:hypothetical protein OIDMADRAFT_110864, partial [Oidiodendron maius Zn]
TYYSLYKCKVLSFSLINRLYINNVLFNYLDNFYTTYLNDILIYSKNKLEYKEYIKKTKLKKYKFRVKYTKYLGFIITIDSIKVNLEKVSIVVN